MLRIAFASTDRFHVNSHFGGAESLVVFDVEPGRADLLGVGQFVKAEPVGEQGRKGLAGTVYDKVVAKLDFLQGCAGLYAASIGASSIRRLMAAGIQPIIVDNGHEILDLLNEVSLALAQPGLLSWVDRARERSTINPPSPFAAGAFRDTRSLITSIDDC